MEICPDKYNKYLERLKQDGYAFEYVPKKYITEELVKIAVNQDGDVLEYVTDEYKTEEIIFMAQQTILHYSDIPTELATRIVEIYETMGE